MSRVFLLWGTATAAYYEGGPSLLSVHATKESAETERAKLERAYERAVRKYADDQRLTKVEHRAYIDANGDFNIVPMKVSP